MKRLLTACALLSLSSWALAAEAAPPAGGYLIDNRRSPHARLHPLPLEAVQWTTGFWADRFQQLAQVTLDESWRLLADPQSGHVLDNFRTVAARRGEFAGTAWQDEWLYKWIEAASCVWRTTRDPAVRERIDAGIALIAAAQQPDGYISTNIMARGKPRLAEPRDHEFYNMGHLVTAGVIHRRMTGRDELFNVARKAADFVCANLGVTVEPYYAHNPSAIMGLVELYRETGEKKYLDGAELIVDRRGEKPRKQALFTMTPGIAGTDLIQDRVPVRESGEIVGHNVFFTYLYTGAADVWAESGDPQLAAALDRLWADMTQRKMFIHGGVSARPIGISNLAPVIEAAGADYELPNAGCYNETCGQIGCFMWGYRMLTNHPDSRFADIMEREMYNGFLGAESLAGTHWFYRNILRRYDEDYQPKGGNDMALRGQPGRREICCPSNLLRTLAELAAYFYSTDDAGLWVHHYGGSKVDAHLADGSEFAFEQVTDYPWDGAVKIVVNKAPARPVALHLRIPGWADAALIRLNDRPLSAFKVEQGYVTLSQTWRAGDVALLSLPLAPQLVVANPLVEEARNQVAVMRGPVLYCVESSDLPSGVKVPQVYLSRSLDFKPVAGLAQAEGPLARTTVSLRGTGLRLVEPPWHTLYRPLGAEQLAPFELTLIPYYAWANRGKSAMSVWLPVVLENKS